MDTFGALGATCVPIALPELFTSLQMGVVNASEGPFDQLVTNKLYEVQDYITLSKYYYSISMWQMNAEFYNGLPEAYRTMIDEAAAEATEYATALGEEMEAELRAQCEDAGVTFCEMTDLQPYLDKVKPADGQVLRGEVAGHDGGGDRRLLRKRKIRERSSPVREAPG